MAHNPNERGIYGFLAYCKNKISYAFLIIVFVLSYGILLFNWMIGIDDEKIETYVSFELISQDRVGWKIADFLFPGYTFLPVWGVLLGTVIISFGCIVMAFAIEKYWHISLPKILVNIIIAIFISFPHIAKFSIFYGNMLTMGYVICMTSFAIMAASQIYSSGINKKTIVMLLVALIGIFLFEKAYITFFCQGVSAYALICRNRSKKCSIPSIIKWILKLCIAIALAFLTAKIGIIMIQKWFIIPANRYTDGYFQYDLSSITAFLKSVGRFVYYFFTIYITKFDIDAGWNIYKLFVGIAIVMAIYQSIQKKDLWIFALAIANVLLSLSIFLVTGNLYLPLRTTCINFAIFIVTSMLFLLDSVPLNDRRTYIFCLFGIYIIGIQSMAMEEVYYSKLKTFEKDKAVAESILDKVGAECGRIAMVNKPIVFMGFLNDTTASYGEVEESSVFVWGRNSDIGLEQTSQRIFDFYRELGYDLTMPNSEVNYNIVREKISQMNSFPQEGCVVEMDDCIIVKLGDSLCEILDDSYMFNINNEHVIGNIEAFNSENRALYITGWYALSDKDAFNSNLSLILDSQENSYKMRLDEVQRADVTAYCSNGYNYDNSGFRLQINLPETVEAGEYNLYIEIKSEKVVYWYDIEEIISIY